MARKEENTTSAILQQLADIKANLAVNSNETNNIKMSIGEIKVTMKEIQSDFISRREFNEALTALREELSPLKKFVYSLIGVVMLAVLGAIINLVLMN